MDRIWQWAWDRYGARYSWAMWAIVCLVVLPVYLVVSFLVVGFERSGHYVEAAAVTFVAVPVQGYVFLFPGHRRLRFAEQWAAGHEVDRGPALEDTNTYARGAVARGMAGTPVMSAALFAVIGAIAGATGSRLIQYGIFGAAVGICTALFGAHSFVEGGLRPARAALGGDTGIGDSLSNTRVALRFLNGLAHPEVFFSQSLSLAP